MADNKPKRTRRLAFRKNGVVLGVLVLALVILGFIIARSQGASPSAGISASRGSVAAPAQKIVDATASTGTAVQFGSVAKILWGIGDEPDQAMHSRLYTQAPVNMITAWYGGSGDLGWMTGYRNTTQISDMYGQGKALELVVFLAGDPQYAISPKFQQDIASLATTFYGTVPDPRTQVQHRGPVYIVLFTELENYYDTWMNTYCANHTAAECLAYRAANLKEEYYVKLRQSYISAVAAIHNANPQAKVALGFGGFSWFGNSDTTTIDLSYWNTAIAASDFTASQEMHACNTLDSSGRSELVPQIRSSVKQLGSYGKPVMISHFQMYPTTTSPPNCLKDGFASFEEEMLTEASLRQLVDYGLFAWNFMGSETSDFTDYVANPGPNFDTLKNFITTHASPSIRFPAR